MQPSDFAKRGRPIPAEFRVSDLVPRLQAWPGLHVNFKLPFWIVETRGKPARVIHIGFLSRCVRSRSLSERWRGKQREVNKPLTAPIVCLLVMERQRDLSAVPPALLCITILNLSRYYTWRKRAAGPSCRVFHCNVHLRLGTML